MDPEEMMRKKFLAKCRFRAIARMVLANTYWMIEAAEQYEGVEDVKRRVAQAVRGKAKKKRLLSINDKALLNKPAELRTDQEKKYIYRIIGGLKCFKRYPDNVKKKLAAVTYFKYYGPGRAIVRQHHEAHALYFIVTGDVIVSQVVFDELIHQNVSIDIGAMHTGDMFGEVSLLHNIPRTATVTTAGHCELLALMKEDFKNVLQASVQKQWDEVKHAMSAFTYFDALDEIPKEESDQDFDAKYFTNKPKMEERPSSAFSQEPSTREMLTEQSGTPSKGPLKPSLRSVVSIATDKPDGSSAAEEKRKSQDIHDTSCMSTITEGTVEYVRQSLSEKSEVLLKPVEQGFRESVRFSVQRPLVTPPNIRTYFMQVCQFNPGATFGFGENMRDRRIIALCPVDCMLLPKIWLLQRNTANIWSRIQHYLEKKIPQKKELFKTFVEERRWQEYRDELVSDIVGRSNTVNWTSLHDVPYSIRIEEMLDI